MKLKNIISLMVVYLLLVTANVFAGIDAQSASPEMEPAITYQSVAEAAAAFERTLLTPGSFDDFMNSHAAALGKDERRVLKALMRVECTSCHGGRPPDVETYEASIKENPYENQASQGIYMLTMAE